MKPLVTTRGDGAIRIITRLHCGDRWMTGWIATGYNPFALIMNNCGKGGFFETEADAREAHHAMVERLDAALLARLEQP